MPVRNTNRMPVSAARCGTRGRPLLGLGFSDASNGWIRPHSSSVSSGLAIDVSAMTGVLRSSSAQPPLGLEALLESLSRDAVVLLELGPIDG